VGAVVVNAGTVIAVYEAVVLRKPLYERIITVTGGAITRPSNFIARIGTSLSTLVEAAGGVSSDPVKIISGGPMMGFAIPDFNMPVTKGSSGLLLMTKSEINEAQESPCLSCGKCVSVCPIGLNPTYLYKWIDHQDYSEAKMNGLLDCRECGCCAYVCPAHIHLVQGFRLGKLMLRKQR